MLGNFFKRWVDVFFVGAVLVLTVDARAAREDTQVVDRDLFSHAPRIESKVESLQGRVDRMSARCERYEFAFCKEVSDLSTDLKEARGEAEEGGHLDAQRGRELDARLQFVDKRLEELETILLAE